MALFSLLVKRGGGVAYIVFLWVGSLFGRSNLLLVGSCFMVCSELRWAAVWLRVECAESWVLMAQSQVEVRSIVVVYSFLAKVPMAWIAAARRVASMSVKGSSRRKNPSMSLR